MSLLKNYFEGLEADQLRGRKTMKTKAKSERARPATYLMPTEPKKDQMMRSSDHNQEPDDASAPLCGAAGIPMMQPADHWRAEDIASLGRLDLARHGGQKGTGKRGRESFLPVRQQAVKQAAEDDLK